MNAIPDLIAEGEAAHGHYPTRAEINARHRERMAEVIKERDDLKFTLDQDGSWNQKAQAMLDAGRWAGHTYIEGCVTELQESRAELAQYRAAAKTLADQDFGAAGWNEQCNQAAILLRNLLKKP